MRARLTVALAAAALALVPGHSAAESVQGKGVRVGVGGELSPRRLPRSGAAPVQIAIDAHFAAAAHGAALPQLASVAIAINRYGRLDRAGLPACEVADIQPATTAKATAACGDSLVGRGSFEAEVALDKQAAFPARGELVAFNGTYHGRPAILAHVYGTEPIPTSFTLPFTITPRKGTFGTVLRAKLPVAEAGYVTGFKLSLHRTYTYRGRRHSFASAGCPAPAGFPGAVFPLARTSFRFSGGRELGLTLVRHCKAL
jgi:hypothetical protein